MKRRPLPLLTLWHLALIGIFASGLAARAGEERDARVEALLPRLQKTLDQYRRATHTPGVAVAVVTPPP